MIQTELDDIGLPALLGQWARGVMLSRPATEIIKRNGSPFMERWMIGRKITVPTFIASRTGSRIDGNAGDDLTPIPSEIENLFIHRYHRADAEDVHCHPWDNGTLVINGYLVEETEHGERRLLAGDIVIRKATDKHAIRSVCEGTVTLFGTGPKFREWGFYPNGEFVHHHDYANPAAITR